MRKSVPEQFSNLRKRAGLSLDDLARKMGYRRASSIQRYESANDFRGNHLSSAVVAKLVAAIVGMGSPPITEREVLALGGPIMARPIERLIPVISYVQAGNWTEAIDAYAQGHGFDEIHSDTPVGPTAFALEIKGLSMMTRFQEQDRIIVDPNIEPIPGDFVVAKEDRDNEATFKQFRFRGTDDDNNPIIDLRPLNEDWPTITLDARNPGHIIGVMVEHHSYRKRSS